MSGGPERDHLARLWVRRWLPVIAMLAATMAIAAVVFGGGDGDPTNDTRRALPWQASVPLIFAIFGVMAWIDWRSMRRHPNDPAKWFGNRGRRR